MDCVLFYFFNKKIKMKKSLLKVAFATVFTLLAGYTAFTSQKSETTLSGLVMENIEALAKDGETADGRKLYEHHCGSGRGTQCKALGVTGNTCSVERSCP